MPGTFQHAGSIAVANYTFFKGRVESRVAGSNKFLSTDHEAAGYCITGGFNADATKTDPDDSSLTYRFWFWTFDGVPHASVFMDQWVDLPPTGDDCVHKATAW